MDCTADLLLTLYGTKLPLEQQGAKPLCCSSRSQSQFCPILKQGTDQLFRASTLSKPMSCSLLSQRQSRPIQQQVADELQHFSCSLPSQRQSGPIQKRGESVLSGPSFARTGCLMVARAVLQTPLLLIKWVILNTQCVRARDIKF